MPGGRRSRGSVGWRSGLWWGVLWWGVLECRAVGARVCRVRRSDRECAALVRDAGFGKRLYRVGGRASEVDYVIADQSSRHTRARPYDYSVPVVPAVAPARGVHDPAEDDRQEHERDESADQWPIHGVKHIRARR